MGPYLYGVFPVYILIYVLEYILVYATYFLEGYCLIYLHMDIFFEHIWDK